MYRFLTGEWKNCPYPCVWLLFRSKMSEATEETITSINWQAELPGVFSVTCVTVEITQTASRVVMGGEILTKQKNPTKATKHEQKHCSQTKTVPISKSHNSSWTVKVV